MLGEPFSSLIVVFRKLRTERGDGLYQIPKKGVTLFARKHHTNSSDGFYEIVVLF